MSVEWPVTTWLNILKIMTINVSMILIIYQKISISAMFRVCERVVGIVCMSVKPRQSHGWLVSHAEEGEMMLQV